MHFSRIPCPREMRTRTKRSRGDVQTCAVLSHKNDLRLIVLTLTMTTHARRRLDISDPPVVETSPGEPVDDEKKQHDGRARSYSRELKKYAQPLVKGFHRIPRRIRMMLLLGWIMWKVTITLLFLRIVWAGLWRRGGQMSALDTYEDNIGAPSKILYIVTSLAEYNNGQRKTVRGSDRLKELLLPVLVDSVESLIPLYNVDVYLILGYTLTPDRKRMILNHLPVGVGLQVWDDATPLGYPDSQKQTMELNTRALSRQHRFVIKDKLMEYDFFLSFEDDMRITGQHVQHFMNMSAQIKKLYDNAPSHDIEEDRDPKNMKFFGEMTKNQIKRLIPGFVRVEVLEDSDNAQSDPGPIPLDYEFSNGEERHFDPTICCHVPSPMKAPKRPEDVVIWETNVTALSLRQLPESLDWVVLLPGPGKGLDAHDFIGGYWSGRDGAFAEKPSGGHPRIVAQQGGWMATREQILQLNSGLCQGSFLPPFDAPQHAGDGHVMKNVEFWSGGYQLFTGVRGGCNMQRVVSMDHFSKHFIYHVANNKQKQLSQERLVRADHLYAQLNSVQKAAERTKASMP